MFDSSWQHASQDRLRARLLNELGLAPFLQRSQIISLGDLPLHCELYHHDFNAPTIIFLPGIGTYSQLYCELMSRMSDQGFNMIAVDIRGHGYSGGERGGYRVTDVIDDIQQLLDYLQQEYKGPFGLFGCSIGSKLGLAITEKEPRIEALLCHTLFLAELPPDMWHAMGWSGLYFSNFFTPNLKVNLKAFIDIDNLLQYNPMGKYADQDPLLVWEYPVYTLHSVYSYGTQILKHSLDRPCAIIIGSDDEVLSPLYTRKLIDRSKQHFDLMVIEDGSHMLPFDHIDDTLRASSEWFQQAFNR